MIRGKRNRQSGSPASSPRAGVPDPNNFVNPYNFIPLHSTQTLQRLDERPVSASRWYKARFSGRLTLLLKTETPLLIMRRVRLASHSEPALLTVRTDPDGAPAVNGASVKGMLRSLYEQATGSRLGVFNHNERLSYRSTAEDARKLQLAKVVSCDGKELELSVFRGIKAPGKSRPLPVLIPVLDCKGWDFGEEVFLKLRLLNRKGQRAWFPSTTLHRDLKAARTAPSLSECPIGWAKTTGVRELLVRGRLHNTGHTIESKKYDRIFVEEILGGPIQLLDLKPATSTQPKLDAVLTDWRLRLGTFTGEPAVASDGKPLAVPPYADAKTRERWQKLEANLTLFVRRDDGGNVSALYPGMVTREMDEHRPFELVPDQFRPPLLPKDLSPADRLFGWVAPQDGSTERAFRGQLSVGGVRCLTPDPIQAFPAQRMATLATPREAHARFYTRAKPVDAAPQDEAPKALDGMTRAEGFDPKNHVISGHKVYPDHGLPEGSWRTPTSRWDPAEEEMGRPPHPSVGGRPLLYLAPNGTKKQVSSEINSWIKPGVEFETVLTFSNLSRDELGALLWIVGQEGHYRLGMGKPLGFGSVKLKVHKSEVRTGAQLAERYRSTSADPIMAQEDLTKITEDFDTSLRSTQPAVYLAMMRAWRGFSGGTAVHYPWTFPAQPQAETFHWFVSNERGEDSRQKDDGQRRALPLLGDDDPRLPTLRKRS